MSQRNRSLRRLLLTGIAVAAVLAATLTLYATRHFLSVEAGELLDAQLARATRLFDAARSTAHDGPAAVLELPDLGTSPNDGVELPRGHEYELHVALQIFDADGQLRMRSANAPSEPLAPLVEGFHDAAGGWRVFVRRGSGDGAWILVGEDDRARHELSVGFSAVSLLIPLGGFGVLLIALLVQADRGLAPVRRLARALSERSPNNLEAIPVQRLPSELTPLAEAFNRYLDRLRGAFRSEQKFTARAAHELRTPLAAIRIHAENALAAESEDQRQQSLIRLREGIDRASRLIGQLLLLTRLEGNQVEERFVRLDAGRLLARVARGHAPLAETRGRRIEVRAPPGLLIRGDEEFLSIALDTLIANALQHSGDDAILLRARTDGDRIALEVVDHGVGMDPARLAELHETLDHADGNRAPGLGLEIAHWIARAHGGELRIANGTDDVGLVAGIHLPPADRKRDAQRPDPPA